VKLAPFHYLIALYNMRIGRRKRTNNITINIVIGLLRFISVHTYPSSSTEVLLSCFLVMPN
jgi:hypothetical protein